MAYTNTEIETQMHSFDQYISSADLSAKPHQTRAVSWCLKKELATEPSFGVRGGLIADDMGLGKTIQMIGLTQANKVNKTLIVVPFPLLKQWESEIVRTTGENPIIFHGQDRHSITEQSIAQSSSASTIVLTTYHMIAFNTKKKTSIPCLLHKIVWDRIIFDEAHHMRNPKTSAFIGAHMITKKSSQAPKWLLTGTPIQNDMKDFYSLCAIIGLPLSVYTDMTTFAEVAKEFLIRRTKVGVKIEMPELTINETIKVAWNTEEEKQLAQDLHDSLSFTRKMKLEKEDIDAPVEQEAIRPYNRAVHQISSSFNSLQDGGCVFPYLLRSRQMCVYPALLKKTVERLVADKIIDGDDEEGNISTLLEILDSSSKMDAVERHLVERTRSVPDTNTIVFCHFREEMDELNRRLKAHQLNSTILDGRTKQAERQKILTASKPYDVLIIQIQAGCEGLNLQKYNDVCFISPHWNPAVEDQAISRAWRIGQTRPVNVFRFEMESFTNEDQVTTLDSYCTEVQDGKREIASRLYTAASVTAAAAAAAPTN